MRNPGLAIFRRYQRFQGGTENVVFPRRVPSPERMNTWADYMAALKAEPPPEDRPSTVASGADRPVVQESPLSRGLEIFKRMLGLNAPSQAAIERYLWDQMKQKEKEAKELDPGMARRPHDEQPLEEGQRLQRGANDVRYTPVTPTKEYPYSTDYEFIHRKVPDVPKELQALRESAYGTIGVNINGQETEVPLWNADMTPAEAEEAARMRLEWGLSPFAQDAELEAVQNAAHQGPDDATMDPNSPNYTGRPGYAQGTSNVNPGLLLFRRKLLKKPKL